MSASAAQWGALWGDRPRAWAVNEEQQAPTYEAALRARPVGHGDHVLDIGCGTGVFLRMCADRAAVVSGVDASEGLLAVARGRVPGADLRHGDMLALPWDDDAFGLVAGFNSFFFADDVVAALREAARVTRPGGTVVAQVFGRPERCAIEAMKQAMKPFRATGDAGESEEYWRPGIVEDLAAEAGLTVERAFDVQWEYVFGDADALVEAMASAGGAGVLAGPDRQGELRAAILDALAPYQDCSGVFRLPNEWHVVLARP